jgi:hypothetical protein
VQTGKGNNDASPCGIESKDSRTEECGYLTDQPKLYMLLWMWEKQIPTCQDFKTGFHSFTKVFPGRLKVLKPEPLIYSTP